MLNPVLIVVAQKVKPETVVFRLVDVKQERAQSRPLRLIHITFEHRILHPNTKIFAGLGDMPQTAFSRQVNRGHIVADKDEHKGSLSFLDIRRVGVEVSTQVACEQERLRMRQQTDFNFLVQERMLDGLLFLLLPRLKHGLACVVIHHNRT